MGGSVLLIDDDVDVLRSIGNYFERLAYEVTRELSGEAGAAGGEVCLLGGRCIQVPTCGRRGACPLRPVTT